MRRQKFGVALASAELSYPYDDGERLMYRLSTPGRRLMAASAGFMSGEALGEVEGEACSG
jgi:hypothetical protein